LLELWEKAGRPIDKPVHFTIFKIIRRLDLVNSGKNYEDIKRQLYQLRQIPVEFVNAFFISKENFFKSLEPFSVLSYLHIYERKKENKFQQRTYGYGEFQFDRHILENLINNYSHPLRLDVIKEFKKHKDLAILLYTYLDRNLAFKDKYEVRLEKLFDHLDLSQRYVRYPAERKRVIEPVLKQLEGRPLSTGILSYCRIHKTEDGRDYKLVARKSPFMRLPEPRPEPRIQLAPSIQGDLSAQLKAKGLTESQIQELFGLWDSETIERQLEIFPFKLEWYRSKGIEVRNPSALLYMMIKGNWIPPSSYVEAKEKEERERKTKHYVLWMCTRYGCKNFHKMIMWPKERGVPSGCPACGSEIEVIQNDYIEYLKDKEEGA
jgi:hypothetical protein